VLAQLQDLDTNMTALRSEAAARLAARRAAWRSMTPRQRRRLTKAAIRDFEKWLEEHPRGRANVN
jgi:hypothetical protein